MPKMKTPARGQKGRIGTSLVLVPGLRAPRCKPRKATRRERCKHWSGRFCFLYGGRQPETTCKTCQGFAAKHVGPLRRVRGGRPDRSENPFHLRLQQSIGEPKADCQECKVSEDCTLRKPEGIHHCRHFVERVHLMGTPTSREELR